MTARPSPLLERLGLHRPELRAWAMYDWANSAFVTTIIAAVFPAFYASVAASGLPDGGADRYSAATFIAVVVAALVSPILGTLADLRPVKKKFLTAFLLLGVGSTAAMFFIQEGSWRLASLLFILGNIGAMGSFVFYDALLPHIARPGELDRVSTAGYALGYLGGGVLLALNLAWILQPGLFGLPTGEGLTPSQATLPVRLALLSVAIWWLLFSLPLLLRVPEPVIDPRVVAERGGEPTTLRGSLARLVQTLGELRSYRDAFLMLVAYLIYSDGIGTIIRMAVIYGTVIGIDQSWMILAILVTQFVGVPCAFLFGAIASRTGPRSAILGGLVIYMGITLLGFMMANQWHFLALAVLVGMVQGGTQALSRSLFATLIPKHRSGEFFGIYGVMDRFSGSIGSGVLGLVVALGFSIRFGILAVLIFFVVGAWLLLQVRVEEGRRRAQAEDLATLPGQVPPG